MAQQLQNPPLGFPGDVMVPEEAEASGNERGKHTKHSSRNSWFLTLLFPSQGLITLGLFLQTHSTDLTAAVLIGIGVGILLFPSICAVALLLLIVWITR